MVFHWQEFHSYRKSYTLGQNFKSILNITPRSHNRLYLSVLERHQMTNIKCFRSCLRSTEPNPATWTQAPSATYMSYHVPPGPPPVSHARKHRFPGACSQTWQPLADVLSIFCLLGDVINPLMTARLIYFEPLKIKRPASCLHLFFYPSQAEI